MTTCSFTAYRSQACNNWANLPIVTDARYDNRLRNGYSAKVEPPIDLLSSRPGVPPTYLSIDGGGGGRTSRSVSIVINRSGDSDSLRTEPNPAIVTQVLDPYSQTAIPRPAGILLSRYRLQMRRVNAGSVPAEVIEAQLRRDGPSYIDEGVSVGHDGTLALKGNKDAITVVGEGTSPEPASIGFRDLSPEPFFGRAALWSTRAYSVGVLLMDAVRNMLGVTVFHKHALMFVAKSVGAVNAITSVERTEPARISTHREPQLSGVNGQDVSASLPFYFTPIRAPANGGRR